MDANLQVFENSAFSSVRALEIDGNPWFVGKDIAAALGYAKPENALAAHVDDEDKGVTDLMTPGGKQKVIIINESGLYSLVLSSKLPAAKAFKRWITSEVIPAIRKTGGYIQGADSMSDEELMSRALEVAHRIIADKEARIAAQDVTISSLTVQNEILRPKGEYFDQLVDRNTLTNFRETAKQLEVSPKKFVTFLLDRKYIYRDKRGKLLPYEDKNDGLFEVRETFNEKTNWSGTQTMITPKGRETFRLLCQGL